MATSLSLTVLVTLVIVALTVSTTQGQPTQNCAFKLSPCANYLNATTKPPNSCCDPIKEEVANDLQCLCNLYNDPSVLAGLGINVQQAMNLPKLCEIPYDANACKTAQAPSGSSTKPPPGSTSGGNGVGKIALSGVFGLLLISACMMLF